MESLFEVSDLVDYRLPALARFGGKCVLFCGGKEVRGRWTDDVWQYVYMSIQKGVRFDSFAVDKGKPVSLPPMVRGVYFLFDRDEIVYVGQSTNVIYRAFQHRKSRSKKFDSFAALDVCTPEDVALVALRRLESAYILKFLPKYNVQLTPSHVWDSGHFEVWDKVLNRQEFYLLTKDARIRGNESSAYDVRLIRQRFYELYDCGPALPPELRARVEASGASVEALIEAGLAALELEV